MRISTVEQSCSGGIKDSGSTGQKLDADLETIDWFAVIASLAVSRQQVKSRHYYWR